MIKKNAYTPMELADDPFWGAHADSMREQVDHDVIKKISFTVEAGVSGVVSSQVKTPLLGEIFDE